MGVPIDSQPIIPISAEADAKAMNKVFFRFSKLFHSAIKESLEGVGEDLVKSVKKTFALKGKRDNNPEWLIINNPQPLIDTGTLLRSINYSLWEQGDEIILTVGTNVPYARTVGEGKKNVSIDKMWSDKRENGSHWVDIGRTRHVDIPERPYMFFAEEDKEDLDKVFAGALDTVESDRAIDEAFGD